MRQLADTLLMVWIKGSDAHTAELVKRFDRAPKPMYYQPHFLHAMWEEYRATHSVSEETCDPDHFVRWTYARALAHRQPRYAAMALGRDGDRRRGGRGRQHAGLRRAHGPRHRPRLTLQPER
jgi:hypothetical protein